MCLTGDKDYSVVFDAARSTDPDGDTLSYSGISETVRPLPEESDPCL